tara:strand:+ start:657 stop:836 length:180 start_codon:yes stop_codon:yes gene_type:complete
MTTYALQLDEHGDPIVPAIPDTCPKCHREDCPAIYSDALDRHMWDGGCPITSEHEPKNA